MGKRKDIFEDIVQQLDDCHYISDLRAMIDTNQTSEIMNVIHKMDVNDYTLEQWRELYQYLFREKGTSQKIEDIYQNILNQLEK